MKIEVGKYAGFCRGVKEAVDKAFALSRELKEEIYTDGELIHNPQTLKMLESRNVKVLTESENSDKIKGKTVIIRAHGVTPQRRDELKSKAKSIKNLTCIDVARVQSSIKEWSNKGYSVVIFGKKTHPEVIGLMGYARDGYVVYNEEDVKKLPELKSVFLVSQTTMDKVNFSKITKLIKEKYGEVFVENTICMATELRQNEVKEMAERNDCIIVIGGKKSSNSKRLYEIGSKYTKTYFFESVGELKEIDFVGIKKLGITAGASTPDWLITEFIEEIKKKSVGHLHLLLNNILSFGLHSNLIASIGIFFLSFAVADNLKSEISFKIGLIVSLFYLSMSLMNSYTNRFSFKIDNPGSYKFISKFRYFFLSLFLLSIIIIFYLSYSLGIYVFILTIFSILSGAVYNLSFLPLRGFIKKILSFRNWDLFSLKSFVLAFTVSFLLNGLYVLYNLSGGFLKDLFSNSGFIHNFKFYFSVLFVFILVFIRQVLFEMKSAQTDRIAGVSSILNIMAEENVKKLLLFLLTFLLLFILAGFIFGYYPLGLLKYLISIVYSFIFLLFGLKKDVIHKRKIFEILVESNLFIAGLISFL